jgi:protein LTV1
MIERQGKRPSKLNDRYVESHFRCMPHTRTDADKQARRAEKKASTTTFSTERKKQLDSHKKLVSNGRAADMAAGTRGVISLS